MVFLLTVALIAIWRATESKVTATNGRIDAFAARAQRDRARAKKEVGKTLDRHKQQVSGMMQKHREQVNKELRTRADAAQTDGRDDRFEIGRSAGARLQLEQTEQEQADALFGGLTAWQHDAVTGDGDIPIVVLGDARAYRQLGATRWRVAGELLPGMLAVQAEQLGIGLVFCDAVIFSSGVWADATDATGEWIVEDLQALRDWANRSGALLVLSSRDELSTGVNRETIRRVFHLELSHDLPETQDGAAMPPVFSTLHELRSAMTGAPAEEGAE